MSAPRSCRTRDGAHPARAATRRVSAARGRVGSNARGEPGCEPTRRQPERARRRRWAGGRVLPHVERVERRRGRRSAGRRIRHLTRGHRPAHDCSLPHAPRVAAAGRNLVGPDRAPPCGARRLHGRGARQRDPAARRLLRRRARRAAGRRSRLPEQGSSQRSTSCARAAVAPRSQGLYGGATMAGGGLALVIVPPLTDATSWRAAYASALVLAVAAAAVAAGVRGLPRVGRASRGVLRDTSLLPLGVLQIATFGLAVIAETGSIRCSNVTVPRRQWPGRSSSSSSSRASSHAHSGNAGRAGPTAGHARRGLAACDHRGRAGDRRAAAVASAIGALALGLAAGLPFAVIFASAQRLRPTRRARRSRLRQRMRGPRDPESGHRSAGLASRAPGDGAAAFVLLAVLALAALPALRHARL